MSDLDVILIGRIAIDYNPTDYYRLLEESLSFKKYLGGSPANIAVGLSRLGVRTGFIGKISDDAHGRFVLKRFQSEGIDTEAIQVDDEGLNIGLTFTEMKSELESSILMYRTGVADLNLKPSEIAESYLQRGKLLVVSGTALSQSPSREAVLKAMLLAKKNHIKIIFDIDYRNYSWKSEEEVSVYYSIVSDYADIIIGSQEEYERSERLYGRGYNREKQITDLLSKGKELVIIKNGKEGSTAYTKEGTYRVKPYPVKMLKGFGGGDAYAAAFLYGYLKGLPIEESLKLARAHAAMLVRSHSCSEEMKSIEEIYRFIEEWEGEEIIEHAE